MKTQPVEPARIEFGSAPGDVPRSPLYDDLYHPRIGALAQAQHVFLQGNGLPQRWQGRRRFVIVETGFGLGNNFLAAWAAWRADATRCETLCVVSIERHPPTRADLRRAHDGSPVPELAQALLQAWPPLTPNVHVLDFEGGRVQLLLALGDVARLLPVLRAPADAFFLDGFAPARNPDMWQPRVLKALGRLAAPGATLATWSVARDLRAGLVTAGFEVELAHGIGGKREITRAHWAPRHAPRALRHAAQPDARSAMVVGAGLAGAAVAQALARAGLAVTVIERRAEPAQETSGNPAGIFHGTVNADDGPYARLFRAAALYASSIYGPSAAPGLLRIADMPDGVPAMQAVIKRLGLPDDHVQALDAAQASVLAGVPLPAPAWFYPSGGCLSPAAWVRQALAEPGITFAAGTEAESLQHDGEEWYVRGAQGRLIASAPIVVLANAAGAAALLAQRIRWPLRHTRGQISFWSGAHPLKMAVAGDGYALPLPDGLLCGATREDGEPGDDDVRAADHHHNLQRLHRLTGLQAPPDPASWQGRTAWRLHSDDRLPIAGALPLTVMPGGTRLDQARLLPRERGLFVLTALGARGLTLAPLLGRLIAAQATGSPWPLEQDLADAVDPGRWLVRAARTGKVQPVP